VSHGEKMDGEPGKGRAHKKAVVATPIPSLPAANSGGGVDQRQWGGVGGPLHALPRGGNVVKRAERDCAVATVCLKWWHGGAIGAGLALRGATQREEEGGSVGDSRRAAVARERRRAGVLSPETGEVEVNDKWARAAWRRR
jgi:hypothetical protein